MGRLWVQTYRGCRLDVPRVTDVDVEYPFDASYIDGEEVAHVLSMLPRFGGRTLVPYSVAQHSLLVLKIVASQTDDPTDHWWAINHEGDEVILGFDPPSPFVNACPHLKMLKQAAMRAYCWQFGMHSEMPQIVKWADVVALATEKRDLMAPEPEPWIPMPPPLKQRIEPIGDHATVKAEFLKSWHRIAHEVGFIPKQETPCEK